MHRLLLAAAFVTTLTCHASAQPPAEPCPGYVLGHAPYKLLAVLEAFCIPVPTASDVDVSIQYGAYNSPHEFLLAYNLVTSSNTLESQRLRIMRYDKQARKWATAELSDLRTEILPGLPGPCLGSSGGGVQKVGALFYVSIELSPSAVCQLVVSDDLKLKTILSGWLVATFSSGAVVLEGSTRHFAPTHPLNSPFLTPEAHRRRPSTRHRRTPFALPTQRLNTEISHSDRCHGDNCESDAEQFDDKTGSLAFRVQFSPSGFISFDLLKGRLPTESLLVRT